MKNKLFSVAAAAALFAGSPAPAQAEQDLPDQAELDEMMAGMAELFPREPLTPEQEARLPAAQRIIQLVIPEGTMGEMMSTMFEDMLQPMMSMGPAPSVTTIAQGIGVTTYDLDLTDEQAAELAAMFDIAFEERQERMMGVFPAIMSELMSTMEPGMREVMAELYAIKFDASELAAIEGFFSTPAGEKYARESFVMASDPRIMSASMEVMPALMASLGDMQARMDEATADLPEPRSYDDLTPQERVAITKATGFTEKEVRENLKAVAQENADPM